jgi:hypothetical protein
MTEQNDISLKLWVYRNLSNRLEGLPDDSPRALELHNLRKAALHEALDPGDAWTVEKWGVTDNAEPHELTEIILAIAANPQWVHAVGAALAWVGPELVKAGVGTVVAETVKLLLTRLMPKQEEKKIADFTIMVPHGVSIQCDGGKITIVGKT